MDFYFFLSYANKNNDEGEVCKFFDDLSAELCRQLGLREGAQGIGFRDQGELKTGADWQLEMMTALQASRTLVCLYSPAYFNSSWCGCEWEVFRLRRDLYVQSERLAGKANPLPPRVIKPVIWMQGDVPEIANGIQRFNFETTDDVYGEEGLFWLIRRCEDYRYKNEYEKFILQLARDILGEMDLSLPAYPISADGLLKQVPNPFVREDIRPSIPPAPDTKRGRNDGKGEKGSTVKSGRNPKRRMVALVLFCILTAAIGICYLLVCKPVIETIEKSDTFKDDLQQWMPGNLGWNIDRIDGAHGRRIHGETAGLFMTPYDKNPFNLYRDFTLVMNVRFIGKKGVAWIVRAEDLKNYYLLTLTKSAKGQESAELNFSKCEQGVDRPLDSAGAAVNVENDQDNFLITTEVRGNKFEVTVSRSGLQPPTSFEQSEPQKLKTFVDKTFSVGGVGLLPKNEREVLLQHWRVAPHVQSPTDKEP